ncbi:unnamed protein product, partial [Symbiodinium sp. CCMP2456]
MLDKIREEATSLLEDGFTLQDGSRYFACLVAVKGDAPAIAKAGNLDRNFQNLGNPLCPECLAGAPGVPFEDCYFSASSIVLIAELGYWNSDSNNFDDVMERAYEDFAHYVKHDFRGGGVPHLKHFTRTNLHYPRTSSFPYMRPKGSDIMLLTRWLGFLMLHGPLLGGARSNGNMIDNPLDASHAGFFRNISAASTAAAKFFRVIHNRGLWLSREYAQQVKGATLQFAEAYSQLAMQCHTEGRARYSLVPSFHYWHHFYVDAKRQLRDPTRQYLLSASIGSCEADEDFIGKVSQ